MDTCLANEIIACLSGNRTLYYDYCDAHAISLLKRYLNGQKVNINNVKNSIVGKLLNRPKLKTLIQRCGDGYLKPEQLEFIPNSEYEAFVLTIDKWSSRKEYRWDQTSRPGSNLVLQLNFSREHDQLFAKSTGIDADYFNGSYHPTCQKGRNTLAWARIDLDLASGEALIEELQTDWLRDVKLMAKYQMKAKSSGASEFKFWGNELQTDQCEIYCDRTLKRYKNWQTTLLTAVLEFLWNEIGINDIYYHSYNTGNTLKNISGGKPPKSLYSDLPKAFCFDVETTPPQMIQNCKAAQKRLKTMKQPYWYRLNI